MRQIRFTSSLCAIALLAALNGCQDTITGESANSTNTEAPGAKSVDAPTAPDDAPDFTETDSGLKYRILRESDGKKPTVRDEVVAHYRGWLDDGTEFDSSYKRGVPTPFPLNQVVAGWTEGLQLIGVGGMIELDVPSDLGYGESGRGAIPPNARLHFIVELVEVR